MTGEERGRGRESRENGEEQEWKIGRERAKVREKGSGNTGKGVGGKECVWGRGSVCVSKSESKGEWK